MLMSTGLYVVKEEEKIPMCIDCHHYILRSYAGTVREYCSKFKRITDGGFMDPEEARMNRNCCGRLGRYFKPKEKEETT
jgi:hypothetical protein